MQLLLIRHAIAEDGSPDYQRALSPRGRRRFEQEVKGLERMGVTLDRGYSSPLVRAAQTAELLAPLGGGKVIGTDLLARPPGPRLNQLILANEGERVAAVGHEPWISSWLALLLEPAGGLAHQLPFKKGAVAWLAGAVAGQMQLVAFLPPRVLRGDSG